MTYIIRWDGLKVVSFTISIQ